MTCDRLLLFIGRHAARGAVPAARVASGRHGGPDAGLGPHPRRHHGERGRVHGGAQPSRCSSARRDGPGVVVWVGVFTAIFAAYIAITQNDIKKVIAYSTISPARLHVRGSRASAPGWRHLLPVHPRLLQGPPVPLRRLGHPRHGRRAGHAQDGRAGARRSPSPSDHARRRRWRWWASSPSPASGPRTRSSARPSRAATTSSGRRARRGVPHGLLQRSASSS